MGSGCASFGRLVDSNTRGPGSNAVIAKFCQPSTVFQKKEPGNGQFKKDFAYAKNVWLTFAAAECGS